MADLNQFLFSISISPRVSSLTKDWKGARTNLSSVFIINSFSFDKPFLIKLLQAGRQIHEMQFFKPLFNPQGQGENKGWSRRRYDSKITDYTDSCRFDYYMFLSTLWPHDDLLSGL